MPRLHMQVCLPGTERKAYIKVFSCCQGHAIYTVYEEERKRRNISDIKFELQNLEIRFHKRQVSFLVVKTVKWKRTVSFDRRLCLLITRLNSDDIH